MMPVVVIQVSGPYNDMVLTLELKILYLVLIEICSVFQIVLKVVLAFPILPLPSSSLLRLQRCHFSGVWICWPLSEEHHDIPSQLVFFSALFCWRCRQSECRKWGYLIVKRMRSRLTLAETWEWKLFVEKRNQIYWELFIFIFVLADFIDDIVHNSNLYVLQKGKDTLAVTGQGDIFFGHWFSCSGWNWNCAFIVLKFTPKHWKVF